MLYCKKKTKCTCGSKDPTYDGCADHLGTPGKPRKNIMLIKPNEKSKVSQGKVNNQKFYSTLDAARKSCNAFSMSSIS